MSSVLQPDQFRSNCYGPGTLSFIFQNGQSVRDLELLKELKYNFIISFNISLVREVTSLDSCNVRYLVTELF